MVSAPALKDRTEHLIPCPASPSGYVVPVAIIYGANASGKSNIVHGFGFYRDSILHSHSRGEPSTTIPTRPFQLDSSKQKGGTDIDAAFTIHGVRYDYGFEAERTSFANEWLYSYPKSRQVKLFERDGKSFSFGRTLRGQNVAISEMTRDNSLFVSAAAQNIHDQLLQIYYFMHTINIVRIIETTPEAISHTFRDGIDDRIIKFLQDLDAGVSSYRYQSKDVKEEDERKFKSVTDAMIKALKDEYPQIDENLVREGLDQGQELSAGEIQLGHNSLNSGAIYFPLRRESAGTRRLLMLVNSAFQALDQGSLLIIDELDTSLHTQACEAIIALFSSRETNPKGAQLIATTHDTNLLRSPMLRRDQIWFTEKDGGGATHLYPLSDFKVRKEDNLEKGYLQGRFGAIPFAGSAYELFGKGDHAA